MDVIKTSVAEKLWKRIMKNIKVGWTFSTTIVLVVIGMIFGIWVYKNLCENDLTRLRRSDTVNDVKLDQKIIRKDKNSDFEQIKENENAIDVAEYDDVLSTQTIYRIVENDLLRNRLKERDEKLPEMFVGMNREQFLNAMKAYSKAVPLSEREKGFVGLEVEAFSTTKVVVRKDYRYVDPQSVFYVAVMGDEVVALMDDKETVYINTGIRLDTLPNPIKMQVIHMIRMENAEELYSFLEAYTS